MAQSVGFGSPEGLRTDKSTLCGLKSFMPNSVKRTGAHSDPFAPWPVRYCGAAGRGGGTAQAPSLPHHQGSLQGHCTDSESPNNIDIIEIQCPKRTNPRIFPRCIAAVSLNVTCGVNTHQRDWWCGTMHSMYCLKHLLLCVHYRQCRFSARRTMCLQPPFL